MACIEETVLCGPAGDSFRLHSVWTDSEGDPIDLTGFGVYFDVTTDGVTTTYTDGDGLTVDYVNGLVDIDLNPSITTSWLINTRWKLYVQTGGGAVITLGKGRIKTNG